MTVYSNLSGFRRETKEQSFRGWLRTIAHSRVVDWRRANGKRVDLLLSGDLDIRDTATRSETELSEETRLLFARAVELVRSEFSQRDGDAFLDIVMHGARPKDVAERFGMSVAAVHVSKSRILKRCREIFGELIDDNM